MKKTLTVITAVLLVAACLFACSKAKTEEESTTAAWNELPTADMATVKPIEIKNSGYTVLKDGKAFKIYYAVEIFNPNEDVTARFPTIKITAKDADGKEIEIPEQVISPLTPGDTVKYGQIAQCAKKPETVEFSVSNLDMFYAPSDDTLYPPLKMFTVSGKKESKIGTNYSFTGTVQNDSSKKCNAVAVSIVLYKDGKMTGGATSKTEGVAVGEKAEYEVNFIPTDIAYDSYEVTAFQWGEY